MVWKWIYHSKVLLEVGIDDCLYTKSFLNFWLVSQFITLECLTKNFVFYKEFLWSFFQTRNGTNITMVTGTALRSNPLYVKYYIFWSKFVFVEVIPYFTILILNSLIIGKIWKSNQFRKRFVVSSSTLSCLLSSKYAMHWW